ncbi:amidase [Aestuariivirga sp.]|uniref:amidase n=1 Tax=Aestuariivirga sp. TaxID=2650926 RepID=UPI0039E239FD
MSELVFKPALELGRLLKKKKLSAMELLGECLTQYARHNDAINAVILTDLSRGRAAARASDKRLAAGEALSPFDGVPMTAKESFDWQGHPSTWGDPAMVDNIAQKNAVALQRMLDAGAVMYGKTNVPLALADWQSFNDVYGTTNNPWDVTRTPGGSSGGSAAALATGMTALEIGSDIGASIRNPAHYCGVYGHKPTYGVVPYRGHLMPGSVSISDITVAGPLARSSKDLTAMMGLLAGTEGIEAHGLQVKLPKPPFATLKDLRVAVKLNSPVSDVDQAYQNRLIALGEFLKKKVKKLTYEAAPAFSDEEVYENYITLLRATATKRMSDAEIDAAVQKARTFDPGDKSYVPLMTRAFALSHGAWLRANERRHQMAQIWDQFFGDWDVLLCPAAASAAWPHDQKGERHERYIPVNGKQVSTIDQRFWAGYSGNFYLPSTIAPIGLTPAGLPVGVQIVARAYGDLTALKVAEWIEEEFGGFVAPPGY